MAAVLALVMVPLIAAIGFFLGATRGDSSIASTLAMATFASLGVGVLVGALKLVGGVTDAH